MKRLVPIVAAALALSACNAPVSRCVAPQAGAEIRLPVIPGRPGLGHFDIDAPAGQGDLMSVTAERVGRIEMHETANINGVSTMRRLERMAPNACDHFSTMLNAEPRRHLMLFDVDPALRAGDQIVMTFNFERGEPRRLTTPVRATDVGHEGH